MGLGALIGRRRNHKDDIMSGITDRYMFLTPITLAVMEDSGHYTIDWSKAENPKWMYKAGCGVFTKKCNTTAGGLGKYFCNDGLEACTEDHRSIGQCNIDFFSDDLPSWAQYFPGDPTKGGSEPLMDYCPIVGMYSNRQCDNPANEETNETVIPSYYANNGRCFKTEGVIQDGFTSSTLVPANCLQTRCVSNAVEFKMPGNDTWIPCPSQGEEVTLLQYGYNGTVICPDPNIICDGVEINAPAPLHTVPNQPTKTPATNPNKETAAPLHTVPSQPPKTPPINPNKETAAPLHTVPSQPPKTPAINPNKETAAPLHTVPNQPTKTPATNPNKETAAPLHTVPNQPPKTPATNPNKETAAHKQKERQPTDSMSPNSIRNQHNIREHQHIQTACP